MTCVAATPDGRYAISAAGDKMIKIWDLHPPDNEPFEKKALSAPSSWINAVVATPDGRHVLRRRGICPSRSGTRIRPAGASADRTYRLGECDRDHTDGKRALTGADDCTVRVWNLSDGTTIKRSRVYVTAPRRWRSLRTGSAPRGLLELDAENLGPRALRSRGSTSWPDTQRSTNGRGFGSRHRAG